MASVKPCLESNNDQVYMPGGEYAEIVSWEDLCEQHPKFLKVLPLAMVPQRDQRGRIIMDLLFAV
jgi:hypothetical protein